MPLFAAGYCTDAQLPFVCESIMDTVYLHVKNTEGETTVTGNKGTKQRCQTGLALPVSFWVVVGAER